MCSGSKYPSEGMRWIKVQMASPVGDLQTSRSITGHHSPYSEALAAQIALSLKKIFQHSLQKKGPSRGADGSSRCPFSFAEHMSLLMIYEQFQPTRTHVPTLDDYDLFSIALHGDDILPVNEYPHL